MRYSLHPGATATAGSTSAASITKQKQLATLAERLAELERRIASFDSQLATACEQYGRASEYAAMQAAM